ncbi:hypothetical protein BBO99_00003634 [Phytophthora kernoviae]|uniref:START domain-containing protein n=2 Tax=Phytophthora kernoviae TaxID=325452 RepID=A0A3R7JR14_9STRA|nr:hypothetical protein G195_005016 [Phytophthora kernoviae 00238/432]KAG2524747.1 hypothetical protein JM16_004816 [Phytophthora kernoviae]KAG2530091.1 hypothetical protein JM18_002523 [Phytophthora kernoviae]RLN02156.1 hypothetical protein BBI17_002336 [Phytophthora kernoviae]RLN81560.1 hypothetical protein BBO99_00003634 [Phytophthora kernoviae]
MAWSRLMALQWRITRNDAKTFPLPDDFFPAVELSDEQIQSYETQVNIIVRNALLEYERHEAKGAYPIYGSPWVSVGTEGSLTAIRQESPEGLSRSEFRFYGRISGNYRNFMDFHYAETSEQLFEWNQFMFGYTVDAVVLKNIHKRSSGKPHEYLGIKWTCLQPSSFSRKRDMCYLEYLTYTKDELGRHVGVRVTLPAEIDECPDLYRTLKVKRVKTHSVTIVRPAGSSSDATQFFAMTENEFAGLSVSAKSFRKIMRMHNDMSMYVESKQISKQGMMSKANWEDMSFVATLDVIDDEVAVLDEKPQRSKLHRKLSSRIRSYTLLAEQLAIEHMYQGAQALDLKIFESIVESSVKAWIVLL